MASVEKQAQRNREIAAARAAGEGVASLAQRFGLSPSRIKQIVRSAEPLNPPSTDAVGAALARRGEYRDISSPKLLIIVAAIIYFVSPFDVIPDWIPVLGHIDDAFVVGLALKSVRVDLDTFMAWETSKI